MTTPSTPELLTPVGEFSTRAWDDIADILAAIDTQPFLAELGDGSLSRERFVEYMAQDALYLADYGKALAAAAVQSTDPDDLIFWSGAARETIVVERALHAGHVKDMAAAQMSPTCTAYTSYLLALAGRGSYPTLAAGVLPCFWIYENVGTRFKARLGDLTHHPYGDWIGAYGDQAFAESTRQAIAICDRLYENANASTRESMLASFHRAAQFEYLFWNAAYHQETWPIG